MIIFGTRGVKFTKEEGQFFCPQCESERAFRHRSVRRFFTLYFIPVIPLDKIGEYVECRTCKGTFVPQVLNYQPEQQADQFLAEYEKALRHSLVLMMLADGEIDAAEKQVVLETVNKFSHNDIGLPELDAYVQQVRAYPEPVGTYLRGVAPRLNEHGKEAIIKCAFAVAAADGHIDDSEIALLKEMGKALEMPTTHMKGIIDEIMPNHSNYSPN